MTRKFLPAATLALAICMAAPGVNAASVFPNKSDMGVVAEFTTAVSSIIDEFEADHSARRQAAHTLESGDIFAGPYRLLVSNAGDQKSSGMVLASLGLMALIFQRRRSM